MGEKEGEKKRIKVFFLRSLEFHLSKFVKPRTKVHHLNEGYARVPKTMGFIEDAKEEILRNKRFWA